MPSITKGSDKLPGTYRIWQDCQKWDKLWWDGGIANQPYVLMLEFSVCEMVHQRFEDYLKNVGKILRE